MQTLPKYVVVAFAVLHSPAGLVAQGIEKVATPRAEPQDKSVLSVAYAGRLLGHMRAPDQQTPTTGECAKETPNEVAQHFINLRNLKAGNSDLLLAAGDIFAPDLDARSILTTPSPGVSQRIPKTVSPEFDNVGCFLIQAGFDAMVPGKHDFYYGPDGLQNLARYLHVAKSTSILGSNLIVVTHTARPDPNPPPTPSVAPKHKSEAKLVLPSKVLPWLHGIELQTAGPPDFSEVWDCLAESDKEAPSDPNKNTEICHRWVAAETIISKVQDNRAPILRNIYRAPATSRAAVAPGHHYLYLKMQNLKMQNLKVQNPKDEDNWDHTRTFDVQYPLLQRLSGDVQIDPNDPDLFHLKEYRRDDQKFWVAVFGVVDPGLRAHIGKLNYSYIFEPDKTPDGNAFDTDVQIADPLESLKQALQACAEDIHCRTARKVLLAQMTRSDALMLSARVNSLEELQKVPPFELVIAQADDGQWTGEMDTFTEMRPYGGAASPMIVVPEPPRYPVNGGTAYLSLGTAELSFEPHDGRSEHHRVTKAYRVEKPLAATFTTGPPSLGSVAGGSEGSLTRKALQVMRSFCNSDVAMLQHRDVYEEPTVALFHSPPEKVQDNLNVLFWKGDYIMCRSVSGATLQSLMKISDQFDQNDLNLLSTDLEKGRGLDHSGILKQGSEYMVGGQKLDPKALYAVAVTDYLAFGDTGYPDLSTSLTPFPFRPSNDKEYTSLAGAVCKALNGKACRVTEKAPLEVSNVSPIHPAPVYSGWRHFAQWIKALMPVRTGALSSGDQQRAIHSVTLSALDFGYVHYFHNRSESASQALYGGVPFAQATAAETSTLTSAYMARMARSYRLGEVYISSQMNYTRVLSKDKTTNLESVNQTANLWANEIGVNVRLIPFFKSGTGLKWTAALHSETQVTEPFQELKINTPNADGTVAAALKRIPVPRNYLLMFKTGPRYQNDTNWIEAGVESGRNINAAYSYAFENPNFTCDLRDATMPLPSCIGNNTTKRATPVNLSNITNLTANTATRPVLGLYLNFNATIPLPVHYAGWALVVSNKGDLYLPKRGDASVDTRYLDIWSHSLQVPIVGSLKFVPKLDLYFYENKITHSVYRGYQVTFNLHYDFDWHSGLRWQDVLWTTQPNTPRQ
jgi:hypothetical protein